MKSLGFVWAGVLLAMQVFARQEPVRLTPAELKADLAIFRAALVEAHPGLYAFHDRAYWTKRFAALERQLDKPMNELAFYRLLNPVAVDIRCGHVKWFRDGKPDDLYAFYQTGLFPLRLYFQQGKAMHYFSYGASGVPVGAEIVSINGKPMTAVTAQLLAQVLVDGTVESARWQLLGEQFAGYYASFIGPAQDFVVGYRMKGGAVKTVRLSSVEVGAIRQKGIEAPQQPGNEASLHVDSLGVTFPKPGVALLRIPVFMPQEGAQPWEAFLQNAFGRIKAADTQHLILDLRNNEGGMDRFGAQLYAWLTNQPFYYYDRITVVSDKDLSFRPYASLPGQYDQLKAFINKQGDEYVFTMNPGLGEQAPQPHGYTGKLYVLINGRSFSVTSEFSAIVRDRHRGVFIGEESGGTLTANNSGGFAIVKLPHSKLTLAVPLLRYHMSLQGKYSPQHGIVPDHLVVPAVEDLVAGRDVVLEKAFQLTAAHP